MENTERELITKEMLEFGRKEYARLNSEPMGAAHWAYIEGIQAAYYLLKGELTPEDENTTWYSKTCFRCDAEMKPVWDDGETLGNFMNNHQKDALDLMWFGGYGQFVDNQLDEVTKVTVCCACATEFKEWIGKELFDSPESKPSTIKVRKENK